VIVRHDALDCVYNICLDIGWNGYRFALLRVRVCLCLLFAVFAKKKLRIFLVRFSVLVSVCVRGSALVFMFVVQSDFLDGHRS